MVEFSKVMDRGKSSGAGRGSKAGAGLSLRKFSNHRHSPNSTDWDRDVTTREKQVAVDKRKALYNQAAEYLGVALSSVQADNSFSLDPGFKIIEKIVDTPSNGDPLFLKAIHAEDSYDLMVSPSVNVAIYAIKMAENLGFSKNRQVEIGMAGLLHDIGMARIPEELVNKQTLTADELSAFKERPVYGYEILKAFKKRHAYLAECALQVHERVDGSGYPNGLEGDEIDEYAQIIGLIDIYEALIHSRPQREKILHFYAVKEIIKTGKGKFQRRFLKAWLSTFSIFPLDSYVRLNSGAVGRVVRTYSDQPLRPEVQIIYDSQSKRVLTERYINLPEHSLLYIVDSVSEEDLVEMGEASYLVTKPGRSHAAFLETEADTGVETEDDADVETEDDGDGLTEADFDTDPDFDSDTDLNSELEEPDTLDALVEDDSVEQIATPGDAKQEKRHSKILLLILAGLLLVAGLVWQLQASTFVAESDPETVAANIRSEEGAGPGVLRRKNVQPSKPALSAETVPGQPGKTESTTAGKPVAPENRSPVKREAQMAEVAATAGARTNQPITAPLSPAAETEATRPPDGSVNYTPGEKQAAQVAPPEQGRYPFSVLLASFRKLADVRAALSGYKAKGLDPFWVKVDLGERGYWFRLFHGCYTDRARARVEIGARSLEGALVKPTRYAVWVAGFRDKQALAEKRAELEGMGFSPYVLTDGTGVSQLFIGAFYTNEGVQAQHTILASAGIVSHIVER